MGSSGAVSAVPPRLDVVTVLGGWWGPPPLPARRICGLAFPKTPGVGRPPPHHHFSPICDSTFCSREFCLFVKKKKKQTNKRTLARCEAPWPFYSGKLSCEPLFFFLNPKVGHPLPPRCLEQCGPEDWSEPLL